MSVRVRDTCPGFLIVLLLIGLAGPATPARAQDAPVLAVSAGYEALRSSDAVCSGCDGNWYPVGFNLDAALPLMGDLKGLGEFGYSRYLFREDPTRHVGGVNALTIGGGLRWEPSLSGAFRPYVQAIVGVQRDSVDGINGPGILDAIEPDFPRTSLIVHPGVGVMVPVSDFWGFVGQVDYRRVFTDEETNAVRVVLGVRLNRR
jgi:hypothetical protein